MIGIESPTYHCIRFKYEHTLFAGLGGVSQVAKSVRLPGRMSAFSNQDPKHPKDCCLGFGFEAP
jgi:hypothetical protein